MDKGDGKEVEERSESPKTRRAGFSEILSSENQLISS